MREKEKRAFGFDKKIKRRKEWVEDFEGIWVCAFVTVVPCFDRLEFVYVTGFFLSCRD